MCSAVNFGFGHGLTSQGKIQRSNQEDESRHMKRSHCKVHYVNYVSPTQRLCISHPMPRSHYVPRACSANSQLSSYNFPFHNKSFFLTIDAVALVLRPPQSVSFENPAPKTLAICSQKKKSLCAWGGESFVENLKQTENLKNK